MCHKPKQRESSVPHTLTRTTDALLTPSQFFPITERKKRKEEGGKMNVPTTKK